MTFAGTNSEYGKYIRQTKRAGYCSAVREMSKVVEVELQCVALHLKSSRSPMSGWLDKLLKNKV